MRKLRILRDGLAISRVSSRLGSELRAVKISFVQALHFQGHFTSFEEMLERYGEQKRLKEDEFYDGYLAIYYGCWNQSVAFLRGAIKRLGFPCCDEFEARAQETSGDFLGIFVNIWTPLDCRIYEWIKVLQLYGKVSETTNAKALADKLKKAIIEAAVNNSVLRLTEEEYLILLSFMADKFSQIFVEVNR